MQTQMRRHAETVVVRGAEAKRGHEGELMLVNGERMAMRLWEAEDAGVKKPEHSNSYEYVAYVLSGRLRITLDGHTFEVAKGDSYCIPANSKYTLEVLERASVVEATSPSYRGDITHTEEQG